MKREQIFALHLALTMASVFDVQAQKPAITCAAGYHTPGMTATITCHFHGQISTEQNTGVYITRYGLGAPKDDSGKEVLMCHFSGGSVSVCNPEPGYRFINFNKNNLTIEVPDVSPEFAGRYSCGVVPADSRTVIPCLLVVKEDLEVPNKEAQGDPDASLRHEELHTRVQTTHNVVIVILIAILMMVATAAVIYVVIAQRRKCFPFKNGDATKAQDPEQPNNPPVKSDDGERPMGQGSVQNRAYDKNQSTSEAVALLDDKETQPPDSHNKAETTKMGESADEKKVETKKERQTRLKEEDKARKDDLKKRLENATKDEKKQIQKEFDKNEEIVKENRKEEEKEWKRQLKEEQRLKQQKKEQEGNAKGKK